MKINIEIPDSIFRSHVTGIIADEIESRGLDGSTSDVFEDEKFDIGNEGAKLEPPPASPNEAPEKTEHEVIIGILTDVFYSKLNNRNLLDDENKLTEKEKEMLITQLKAIGISASELLEIIREYGHAPAWAESKITVAANDMSKLMSYMMAEIAALKDVVENKRSNMKKQDQKVDIREAKDMKCLSQETLESGKIKYTMSGSHRAWFPLNELTVGESEETRKHKDDNRGRPPKFYNIEGIASSTSIDSYGTEMSYEALMGMADQMKKGVPILPAHAGKSGGVAEWDEVIGRSYDAEIMRTDDIAYAADMGDEQYTLLLRSRLYGDEDVSRKLIRRLKRGEPIGQSIGGWFDKVDVIENREGEIERIIVRSVTLDHIAVTRAPANPDSFGLMTHSIRSKIEQMKSVEPDQKRHIVKIVEYEDKIDVCFGKSKEFMGIFKEGEEMPEMAEEYSVEEYSKKEAEEKREAYLDTDEKIIAAPYDDGGPAKEEETPDPHDELNESDSDNQEADPDGEAFPEDSNDHNPMLEVTENRTVMKFREDLALADVDEAWEWDVTAQDEVLGEGLDNWKRYAVAHLYMDNGKDFETKEAYKLPIAKMQGGELRVFFRACAAALAALNGARGGVKGLTQEEREIAHNVLAKYYEKFDKEIPPLRGESSDMEYSDIETTPQYIEEDTPENLDKLSGYNHIGKENAIAEARTESTSNGDDEMTENDITKIADLLRSSLEPVTARLDALEEKKETENRAEEKIEKVEVSQEVSNLQKRLNDAEAMIVRFMETPIRQGRHNIAQIRGGSGSETAIDGIVTRAKEEGLNALPVLVSRHKETLAEETEVSKLSVNQLKDLLAAGLRAAEMDGLIVKSTENTWK